MIYISETISAKRLLLQLRKLAILIACHIQILPGFTLAEASSDSLPAYQQIKPDSIAFQVESIHTGNIYHVLQLAQNRIAGMDITHPGGSVFEPFIIRTRGIQSFSLENSSPLVLLNGMPIENPQFISPWDIDKIAGVTSGSSLARYGLRGLQGVIAMETKKAMSDTWGISYTNHFSIDRIARETPVLNSGQFVNLGGNDLGESHDWMEEISRTGFDQMHRVALSHSWKQTRVLASGEWRNAELVLRNSSSEKLRGNISLEKYVLNRKLKLSWNTLAYQGDHQFGEPRAFLYALRFNPTAPVSDPAMTDYGGYFQEIKFDYYNPVAMIEQVHFDGKEQGMIHQFAGQFNLLSSTRIKAQYGIERSTFDKHRWISANSFFTGVGREGYVELYDQDLQNDYLGLELFHSEKIKDLGIDLGFGYSNQLIRDKAEIRSGSRFENEVTDMTVPEEAHHQELHPSGISHRLIQFHGNMSFLMGNYGSLSSRLIRGGSSRLGDNHQWGWFYGIDFLANLSAVTPQIKHWSLFYKMGRTGAPPPYDNLSIYVVDPQGSFYYNGSFTDYVGYRHDANPDLKWERRDEWELGMEKGILRNKVKLKYSLFFGHTKDIITREPVPSPPNIVGEKWINAYSIKNQGWEFTTKADILQNDRIKWSVDLNLFRSRPFLQTFPPGQRIVGGGCGCGGKPYSPVEIKEGEPLGKILAWRVRYSLEEQRYVEIDQNRDGWINRDDQREAGNAYPSWQLGMSHTISFGNLALHATFGGAFGHHLINMNRLNYEVRDNVTFSNIVSTKYLESVPVQFNVFSDRFVEKASYFQLDQLFMSFDLSNLLKSGLDCKLFAGSQNLITFTGYTDDDPEVRYQNIPYAADGSPEYRFVNLNGGIARGIDHEFGYPFTRSFYLGLQIDFP